jgi:hypothetical protein
MATTGPHCGSIDGAHVLRLSTDLPDVYAAIIQQLRDVADDEVSGYVSGRLRAIATDLEEALRTPDDD